LGNRKFKPELLGFRYLKLLVQFWFKGWPSRNFGCLNQKSCWFRLSKLKIVLDEITRIENRFDSSTWCMNTPNNQLAITLGKSTHTTTVLNWTLKGSKVTNPTPKRAQLSLIEYIDHSRWSLTHILYTHSHCPFKTVNRDIHHNSIHCHEKTILLYFPLCF